MFKRRKEEKQMMETKGSTQKRQECTPKKKENQKSLEIIFLQYPLSWQSLYVLKTTYPTLKNTFLKCKMQPPLS